MICRGSPLMSGVTPLAYDTAGGRLASMCIPSIELTNATSAVDADYRYGYDFDDIGNRKTTSERGTNSVYTASQLNQYTAVDDFTPTYDADGNETLVKTATGIWQVTYNGENRPVRWELVSPDSNTPNSNTQTLLRMSFDRMGRRVTKNDQRFVYDGYLQIANFHCSPSSFTSVFIWDPTEPVATRPLVWNRKGDFEYYVFDGNKNVSEVVASNNDVAAHYEYAPFGALTVSSGVSAAANPWRFSSEYAEDDTATVYYNYRHYEPVTGRWMCIDPAYETAFFRSQSPKRVNHRSSLYQFLYNQVQNGTDYVGLSFFRSPCNACDSLKCRNGCSKTAASKGFKSSFSVCVQEFYRVECKCYGVCELLKEVKPAYKGGRYSCSYKCGNFGFQSKDYYAPCKQIQLWGL